MDIIMKENDKDFCYVWWYYNKRYSETGHVGKNLTEVLNFIRKEGMFDIDDEILKQLRNNEYYEEFNFKIKRIKYYGNIDKLDKYNVYILRYPNAIFENRKDALKEGLKYCFEKGGCNKYYRIGGNKVTMEFKDFENYINTNHKNLSLDDLEEIWDFRIDCNTWNTPNHIE